MTFNLRKILFSLACLYAFISSFDQVLEMYYAVDTVFKPSRVVALLILLLSPFYQFNRWKIIVFQIDKCWVFLFTWGVVITLLRMFLGIKINLITFLNDGLQILFLLMTYLAIKRLEITWRELLKILAFYTAGVCLNNWLIILSFYILKTASRAEGMVDNSNGAAFAIGIGVLYFIYRLTAKKINLLKPISWFYLIMTIYLIMGVLATGSRTGLLVVGLCIPILGFLSVDLETKFRGAVFMIVLFPLLLLLAPVRNFLQDKVLYTLTNNAAVQRLENTESDIRIYLWHAGFNSMADNFGTGLGLGQFRNNSNYKKYMLEVAPDFYLSREVRDTNAGLGLHSLFVQIAVDYGFIPLLALLYFFYRVLVIRLNHLVSSKNKAFPALLLVILIDLGVSSNTGQGMFSSTFWITLLAITFYPPKKI